MPFRRGCGCSLPGCGGLFLIAIIFGLLVWFVGVPRGVDVLQDKVAESLATAIEDDFSGRYSIANLRSGGEVRFDFLTLNRILAEIDSENAFDTLAITTDHNRIVLRVVVSSQSYEYSFATLATNDGHLKLVPSRDGNWFEKQGMNVLGGGFEKAINTWLDENGLMLIDVSTRSDALILSVTGR